MKFEDLTQSQVSRIKYVIRLCDELADISDEFLSSMLIEISLIAFGRNGPRWFNDNRWHEVVKIYDAAKEEMSSDAAKAEMGNGT